MLTTRRPHLLVFLLGLGSVAGCNALTGGDQYTVRSDGSGGNGGAASSSSSSSSSSGSSSTSSSSSSGSSSSTSSSSSSGSTGGAFEAASQLCVDTINKYRATLGLTPYQRWGSSEACTSSQAQTDSEANGGQGQAHSAFGQCSEWAQNECPGWPGPPESMIPDCLAMMWAEGPGDFSAHGHYINMSSTQYTQVSCGFYVKPDGSVWAAQDFQ